MEKEVKITHIMVVENTAYYPVSIRSKKIIKAYQNVEKFRFVKVKGITCMKVTGTHTLYGYKVEDGGFFDVENDAFYSEQEIENEFKSFEIKKCTDRFVEKEVKPMTLFNYNY